MLEMARRWHGVLDESDPSTQFTALRETKEEIGIDAESIDILGCYSALPNKTGSLKVYPYVGFIKDQVDLTKFNPDEVSSVFTLPVDYLIQPEVRQLKKFRESKMTYTEFKVPDHIEGEKQIWGLTSFILDGKSAKEHYWGRALYSWRWYRCFTQNHARALSLI